MTQSKPGRCHMVPSPEAMEKILEILGDDGFCDEFRITVLQQEGNNFDIEVCQMYEHCPHGFKTMSALASLFGAKDLDIESWSSMGCETCDYGSRYSITFQLKGVTQNYIWEK